MAFFLETLKYRIRVCEYKGRLKFRRPLIRLSVNELLELPLRTKIGTKSYSIPTTKPIELPYQDLPIPPFVFGFWFHNRYPHKKHSVKATQLEHLTEKFKDCGYQVTDVERRSKVDRKFRITPSIELQLAPNVPHTIPNNYLLASPEQRIALLSGILSARNRQYLKKTDEFRITNRRLAPLIRIQGLVESLGSRTRILFDETYKYYTLFFRSRIKLLEEQESPPFKIHHARRYIVEINPLPSQSCIHIETSGEDNTILVGEGFISTC